VLQVDVFERGFETPAPQASIYDFLSLYDRVRNLPRGRACLGTARLTMFSNNRNAEKNRELPTPLKEAGHETNMPPTDADMPRQRPVLFAPPRAETRRLIASESKQESEPMKMLMIPVAVGVMLATSSAWAQDYRSDDRSAYRSDYRDGGERGRRSDMRDGMRGGPLDNDTDRYADRSGHDEGRQGGEGRGRRDYPRGPGAGFWIKSGELSLGARCPQGESMRSCVDAALVLLDRAKASPPSSGTASVPSAPPPR
jgi:hypothetical protein